MREVRISDVTMRRAAKFKTLTLTFKEKLELAKLLDRVGASVIEVEGIENPKADSLRIKSIASIVKNSILSVPVDMDDDNIELTWASLKEAKRARLQVHAAVSPAQMEYIHRKKAPAMMEAIVSAVAKCASLANDVELVADDATRADRAFLVEVINKAIEAGATTVSVCDAAGLMLPDEFAAFVGELYEEVPALRDVTLGVSVSDNLFVADACAIAGIVAGVGEVKASTYPLGVASTGRVAKILSEKGGAVDVACSVHTTEMKRIAGQIAWICENSSSKGTVLDNASEADETIVLTEHDDIDAVMECVGKLGYDLSAEDAASVYEAFKRVASKKESIGSRELDAIVASAALQVPPTYVIDNYVINSGNTIRATARVQMRKDDKVVESVGVGDGPIDAAFMAIEDIAGRHFELDDFQIQAVTEGKEAMGETVVKLVSNGKVYSGRGISTDIVGSSIRAFVNALNKIVYEELS